MYILIPFIQNFSIQDYIKGVMLFFLDRQSDHTWRSAEHSRAPVTERSLAVPDKR